MASLYRFEDYSSEWPTQFQVAAGEIRALVASECVDCLHIGSTSVEGLAAKATIDMLLVVHTLDGLDRLNPGWVDAGYRVWGEYGLPGRRYFSLDELGYRVRNVHSYAVGDPDIARHLAFPAYLRAHPTLRDEYAALKRAAFAQHATDLEAYQDDKHEWIRRTQADAQIWYRAQHGDAAGGS